jgi:hypothetical protein
VNAADIICDDAVLDEDGCTCPAHKVEAVASVEAVDPRIPDDRSSDADNMNAVDRRGAGAESLDIEALQSLPYRAFLLPRNRRWRRRS